MHKEIGKDIGYLGLFIQVDYKLEVQRPIGLLKPFLFIPVRILGFLFDHTDHLI